ncbi:hypothetical protein [Variovorax sp. UMC13]|uniref:hypothetical protein n=1 Tax=Variovorax sp. UMC13 TaxID=1862326 RepID=UPI0015FF768F|nr:hypothetical protein [Variovorax sp. UMC13]
MTCHRCEFSSYAKRGTKAARLVRAAMTPEEGEQPAPAPAPAPAAPKKTAAPAPVPMPTPKPARASSAFNMGQL